jgi:hypothetical protein
LLLATTNKDEHRHRAQQERELSITAYFHGLPPSWFHESLGSKQRGIRSAAYPRVHSPEKSFAEQPSNDNASAENSICAALFGRPVW